jgi:hypothetical protein
MNTRKRFIAFAGCTTAFRRSAPIDLQGGFARRPLRGTATNSPTTTRRAARIRRMKLRSSWTPTINRAPTFTMLLALILLVNDAVPSFATPTSKSSLVKTTMDQAKAIALAAVPGTIKHAELEKEHGKWIYSIEIRPANDTNRKHIKEVNIDANTGKVLVIEDENDGDD